MIDAMDLMGRGHLDGFCPVTSDCDFTRLAWRLRAEGKTVRAVGRASASQSFRVACSDFFLVETLIGGSETDADRLDASKPGIVQKTAVHAASGKPSPQKAVPVLEQAVASLPGAREWHNLAEVGSTLKRLSPGFSSKSYEGCTSLLTLMRQCGAFRVRKTPKGGDEIARRV